ncbi:MAG: peptidoglycan editing factor PgeF [Ruminococcus sp.]|nr:peptidoglycan editing factor PgeF [Ruminococcus sp.]
MTIKSGTMTLNKNKGVSFLTYNRLSEIDFINHAFSTRLGGVSKGIFESMNLSFEHDDFSDVTENYKRMCDACGFEFESLVASSQDHHTFVRVCTKENCGVGIYKPKDIKSVDALVTNEKGVTLVTYYADCTPLFFVDTKKKAIGLAHAGWRGTVGKIGAEVIKTMTLNYGTDPDDLICAIGPAISKCCYEVDKMCADNFYSLGLDDSRFVFPREDGKFMVDLLECNRQILVEAGVKAENITVSDLCTKCNSELLWSHRATNGKRGTMSAFMSLK